MRRRGSRRLAVLAPLPLAGVGLAAVAALAVIAAAAAADPQEVPRVSGLYETTTSEIVLIELWALDANGGPVSDLTADEMELVVDSYRRPIASFEPMMSGSVAAPPDAYQAPERPAGGAEAVRARRFVLFFNDVLSKAGSMTMARQAAIDFVTKGSVAGDQFALASAQEHRRLRFEPFTDDRDAVVASLRRSRDDPGRISNIVLEMERPPSNEAEAHRIAAPGRMSAAERTMGGVPQVAEGGRAVFRGLEAIIAMLGPYKGPKAVVVFGDGLTGVTNIDIEEVTRAASAAQVTIHTGNTSGLVAGPVDLVAEAFRAASNLATFADETGGLRVQNSNDPTLLFQRIEAAAAGAYVLSYVPEGMADGRPHTVRLSCRCKGVTLRYRKVFIRETPEQARERVLQAAFIVPALHAGFGLDAMTPVRPGARDLLLYVPAGRLLFLPSGPTATARIEIGAVALDEQGKQLARLSRRMDIRVPAADVARRRTPLNLVLRGVIPSESRSVTAVVSDLNSGALGSSRLDPASESHVEALRGFALGDADESSLWVEVPSATPGKTEAKTATPAPTMRTARRVGFSTSERPVCEIRFGASRPESASGLRLVIADAKRLLMILPLDGAEQVKGPEPGLLLRTQVPLKDLEPGEFVLRVEDMRGGSPVALGSMPIRIEPAVDSAPATPKSS